MMVYLGTSSWYHAGWEEVFYPTGLKRTGYLQHYARRFNSVEVNTSFYGLPDAKTLIRWTEETPPGFRFVLKFPRAISHERRLRDCETLTFAFLDVLWALGKAAGPAFLQLPASVSRARDGKALADYLEWLATVRGAAQIAVEVRNPDLMTASFGRFLCERGFSPVLVDRAGTDDTFELWQEAVVSAGFALIRWIGDDKHGPKANREIVAPRDEQLDVWARRVAHLAERGCVVYGYMHNPYEGHSPASVERLQTRLRRIFPLPIWSPDDEAQVVDAGENSGEDNRTNGEQLPLL